MKAAFVGTNDSRFRNFSIKTVDGMIGQVEICEFDKTFILSLNGLSYCGTSIILVSKGKIFILKNGQEEVLSLRIIYQGAINEHDWETARQFGRTQGVVYVSAAEVIRSLRK